MHTTHDGPVIARVLNESGYMIIGVIEATISIPDARSLKDKRAVVRGLRDRITQNMNVRVAEVGKQAFWKPAALARVTVAAQKATVEKRLSEVVKIESAPRYVLMQIHTEYPRRESGVRLRPQHATRRATLFERFRQVLTVKDEPRAALCYPLDGAAEDLIVHLARDLSVTGFPKRRIAEQHRE